MSSGMAGLIQNMRRQIDDLQRASLIQQEGAFLYITAMVHANGGAVELSKEDMEAAIGLVLERGDPEDGGLILRTSRPEPSDGPPQAANDDLALIQPSSIITEHNPTLAQVHQPIILPE
jgi:hypothetical protein